MQICVELDYISPETHSKHGFPQVLVSEVSVQVIFCSVLLETTGFPRPSWFITGSNRALA